MHLREYKGEPLLPLPPLTHSSWSVGLLGRMANHAAPVQALVALLYFWSTVRLPSNLPTEQDLLLQGSDGCCSGGILTQQGARGAHCGPTPMPIQLLWE